MRLTLLIAIALTAFGQDKGNWPRHIVAQGFRNQTAVAADFTGDGRPDVIAADIGRGKNPVTLFVAPDWKPVLLNEGIATIHSAVIDVNGDGRPDFIGCRYHPGLVYWLERPANPLRDRWPLHIVDDAAKGGISGIHGLMAADVDGDGKLDLIGTSGQPQGTYPDSLAWFTVGPRWQRHIFADRDATGLSHYVGFGDVNGDGRGDIAAAAKEGPGGNWFAWWEQPADPTRGWKKHPIADNQFGATNILIADLNGDRRADFVASRGHGAGVVWYEAPDWKAHEMAENLKGAHSLATGDVDGDGDIDFATVFKDSRVAAWFDNDGKGRFTMHTLHTDQSAYDARLVDLDGDKDLDLLVAGFESDNVVWFENRAARRRR